jgi:hypothetical protein
MAATGKTEIWSAISRAASNDFMCEHHTGSTGISDNNKEQPNSVPEGNTDEPKQRKQGTRRGKKKLFDIAKVVMDKESPPFQMFTDTRPNRVPSTTIRHSPSSHLQEGEPEEEASRQKG